MDGQKRAKYLRVRPEDAVGRCGPGNDNQPAVTLTRAELGALVEDAVTRAAGALALAAERPALLDRAALALALGCSGSLVDKLRRQGMPHVRLGDSPRFELERCLDWLRKAGAA